MNILITIQHPAHVHFFKNAIWEFEANGDSVHVVARENDIAIDLLKKYGIGHEVVADRPKGLLGLAKVQAKYEYNILQKTKNIKPDVLAAIGEPSITHAAAITDSKSIIFTDTEHATLQNLISQPFADRICTPDCYQGRVWRNHVEYPSYHELAYLHPSRFNADGSILEEIGLTKEDRFVILRTVDWNAAHDINDSGFENVTDVVEALEQAGVKVFITSEGDIPKSVKHCQLTIEPHQIHHLMRYADLFIGESATMACESAVLGTPAIFVSTSRRGYTDQLEKQYELVFNYSGDNKQMRAGRKALSILDNYTENLWKIRRKRLLREKIDTTEFVVNQIRAVGNP